MTFLAHDLIVGTARTRTERNDRATMTLYILKIWILVITVGSPHPAPGPTQWCLLKMAGNNEPDLRGSYSCDFYDGEATSKECNKSGHPPDVYCKDDLSVDVPATPAETPRSIPQLQPLRLHPPLSRIQLDLDDSVRPVADPPMYHRCDSSEFDDDMIRSYPLDSDSMPRATESFNHPKAEPHPHSGSIIGKLFNKLDSLHN